MPGQRKSSMELRERATRMALEACAVLGTTASGRVCCSRANPMLRVVTRYVACQPAIWSVGGAA